MRLHHLAAILLLMPSLGAAWEFASGETIGGHLTSFEFAEKQLTFTDPISSSSRSVPSKQLSFSSLQKLTFSPAFHRSFPKNPFWSPEKRSLLNIISVLTALPLFIGFWISGKVIASKSSPLTALAGFAGSWIVGAIFVMAYAILYERFDGGAWLIIVGFLTAAMFLSIFVSAIYGCTVMKGLTIFMLHLFAGLLIALIGFGASEILIFPDTRAVLWETHIFVPVGILSQ